jgi:ubiquinone/menaquinone biosynthesis C-methylase UbiE
MKRLLLFSSLLCGWMGWSACHEEAPVRQEPPALLRESPSPATAGSDNLTLPKTGAGNFENLVADYESKDRGIWQKPDMVISLLGNLEGKTVADIGAGTGYFTFRLVPKAQKVIGIDIDRRFINFLDSIKVHLPEQYRSRFESRLAKPDNPMLQPNEADAVMVVNTYGYIDDRPHYLKTLFPGMTPGAKLLIIDFKKNNIPVGPPEEFKVALSQVERELVGAGFVITKIDKESLDYQYIIVAEKPATKK